MAVRGRAVHTKNIIIPCIFIKLSPLNHFFIMVACPGIFFIKVCFLCHVLVYQQSWITSSAFLQTIGILVALIASRDYTVLEYCLVLIFVSYFIKVFHHLGARTSCNHMQRRYCSKLFNLKFTGSSNYVRQKYKITGYYTSSVYMWILEADGACCLVLKCSNTKLV